MTRLFLDASYAIALSAPTDQHHLRAVEIASRIQSEGPLLVTTRAVVLEIGNALAKRRYRSDAICLLTALEQDPTVEIIALTEELYHQGLELFGQRDDKEWGITDCISFVLMQDLGLTDALTADHHFQQAGFHALLLEA